MLPRLSLLLFLIPSAAIALDKQTPAHSSAVGGCYEQNGFNLSGELLLGSALYNPSFAARPDNTGRALFRLAFHTDIDLIGRYFSVPIDLNLFTDGNQSGFGKLRPTEFDFIGGVTSTWSLPAGSLEVGVRCETDQPLDEGWHHYSQTYVDVRTRYLFEVLGVTGWVTLGWFIWNPTYAARPDNSGRALFRYILHTEVPIYMQNVTVGVDATFFSDRVRPTELDMTPEIGFRYREWGIHLAYERDMPLDRGGLVQGFLYWLVSVRF